ncbi:hypothetical protein GXM_03544 [Nostoc sphaeroides CCNUC1]|uniref:Uncharacterized protein n=1 Tax=Nostoc sphaeroides CCNUC1 TaxID=2653204 RepID=A0A5P8W0F1_9NOSO|nr:hypothetical protein GXM_03544 [Nostoc sphaeroides CCNUC1]
MAVEKALYKLGLNSKQLPDRLDTISICVCCTQIDIVLNLSPASGANF